MHGMIWGAIWAVIWGLGFLTLVNCPKDRYIAAFDSILDDNPDNDACEGIS